MYRHEKFIMVNCSNLHCGLDFRNVGNCTGNQYRIFDPCFIGHCHYSDSLQYHYRQEAPWLKWRYQGWMMEQFQSFKTLFFQPPVLFSNQNAWVYHWKFRQWIKGFVFYDILFLTTFDVLKISFCSILKMNKPHCICIKKIKIIYGKTAYSGY